MQIQFDEIGFRTECKLQFRRCRRRFVLPVVLTVFAVDHRVAVEFLAGLFY